MKTLKLKFVDFWFGFSETDNYFYNLLKNDYIIELVEKPDILIYSCYGNNYLNYSCVKIFYTAENMRPDFFACDYAISFDYNTKSNHLRLPLYAMYIENLGSSKKLLEQKTLEEARNVWRSKTKFCCMVVSNGMSKHRLNFYKKINAVKIVDSGGKLFNNVGGPVVNKMEFIKNYKFVLSFENSSNAGYTTEKILEPFYADCIPIYWGDPKVANEFNTERFVHFSSDKTEEEIINEILAIEADEQRAINMLMSSTFVNNNIPSSIEKEKVLSFFNYVFENYKLHTPVAANRLFRKIHKLKRFNSKIVKRIFGDFR